MSCDEAEGANGTPEYGLTYRLDPQGSLRRRLRRARRYRCRQRVLFLLPLSTALAVGSGQHQQHRGGRSLVG